MEIGILYLFNRGRAFEVFELFFKVRSEGCLEDEYVVKFVK